MATFLWAFRNWNLQKSGANGIHVALLTSIRLDEVFRRGPRHASQHDATLPDWPFWTRCYLQAQRLLIRWVRRGAKVCDAYGDGTLELVTSNKSNKVNPTNFRPFNMWSAMIQIANKFSYLSPYSLCYETNFCGSNVSPDCLCGSGGGDHGKTTCSGHGVWLMLGGISSPLTNRTIRARSPCSRTFALHSMLVWTKRLIQLNDQAVPDSSKLRSNLAGPSYGILESWVDVILLNKLGSYASNSVKTEPDPPSFYEVANL